MITTVQLDQLTDLDPEQLKLWADALNKHIPKYLINTPLRRWHFISQILHESLHLSRMEENLNYSSGRLLQVFPRYFKNKIIADQYAGRPEKIANRVYASRMGNGNEASGEGWKYRGRGAIMLTGKNNYKKAGLGLYGNEEIFIENPDLLLTPDVAVQGACWFWNANGCNEQADEDDITGVTRRINGGLIGIEDRKNLYRQVKKIIN